MTGHDASSVPDQPRTIAKGGGRQWIYPVEVSGKWQRVRLVTSAILLLLFYGTPWFSIDGQPFLRLSFLTPSFTMFGSKILIYEFYHFVLLALLLVLTLFMASAFIGRVWCGYACPQTVFIEQILGRIDRVIEGPAHKRLLDSKRPWTSERLVRRLVKYAIYTAVSLSFAFTLVALFTGPELILTSQGRSAQWAVSILTCLALFDAIYWREQFCHIVCPYARFQNVMQDRSTITIGYDVKRGEPRGRLKHKPEHPGEQYGDCIDCGLCVRVCPSGIDIRQGPTQLECTACARCIDACSGVMANLGRPAGLIRYDVLDLFERESSGQPPGKSSVFRTRTTVYLAAWIVLFAFGLQQFISRAPFHVKILNPPGGQPWVVDGNHVKNLVTLKIGNQSATSDTYTIAIDSLDPDETRGFVIETPTVVGPVESGTEVTIPILISTLLSHVSEPGKQIIKVISNTSGSTKTLDRYFLAPHSSGVR